MNLRWESFRALSLLAETEPGINQDKKQEMEGGKTGRGAWVGLNDRADYRGGKSKFKWNEKMMRRQKLNHEGKEWEFWEKIERSNELTSAKKNVRNWCTLGTDVTNRSLHHQQFCHLCDFYCWFTKTPPWAITLLWLRGLCVPMTRRAKLSWLNATHGKPVPG